MTIFRFRVYWQDDDQTYRDIEIQAQQTFIEFHKCIIKAYEFDGKHAASFYVSDEKWNLGLEINSEVLVNKKGAKALSMEKTTVSALVGLPDQKFVYTYNPDKPWTFLVELINVGKDFNSKRVYPFILRKEGIAPAQYGIKGVKPDKIVEIEEKYDVGIARILEGFLDDEDESTEKTSEGTEEETAEDNFTEDEAQSFVE